MTTDPRRGDVAVVARADIARLTLRLRAAQREAIEAEAAANTDPTAVAELEARLVPLIEQRRDALTAELERVRDEALQAIADARRQADDVLARFAPPAPSLRPPAPTPDVSMADAMAADLMAADLTTADLTTADATTADLTTADATTADLTTADLTSPADTRGPQAVALPILSEQDLQTPAQGIPVTPAEPVSELFIEAPVLDSVWAPSRPSAAAEAAPVASVPSPPPPVIVPAASVMIDAEAFARVFANMIAQVIDERDRHAPAPPQYTAIPPQAFAQMMPVAPPKQGFWATARHLDVLLLSTTMVIALVILAAWLA